MSEPSDSDEAIVEHLPSRVLDFSSQYGSGGGRNYNIVNICTHPDIYPLYGDSTNALVFRTYGPWWINMPSFKETRRHFKRGEAEFTSRDYIDIEYPELVYECISLNIYETYNPGSLEVVYAGKETTDGSITWHQVWKFPQPFSIVLTDAQEISIENGRQQMRDLFPDHVNTVTSALRSLRLNTDHEQISTIYTHHTYPPAARLPRILKIPLRNKISFPTRHIRLEFDHCTANYYIEIDTITLVAQTSNRTLSSPAVSGPPTNDKQEEKMERNPDIDLTKLPFDILFLICSYLDLRSLIHLSSTCRQFRQQCLHPLQFHSVDLQPYWNTITDHAIEHFFTHHCIQTQYLSLAWTKAIQSSSFHQLLHICSNHLLQLSLACCVYLTGEHIQTIANECPNIQILNLQNCTSLDSQDFIPLQHLHHIRSLNVYRTRIDYRTLLPLINNNKKHFETINLGSCQYLIDTVGIVKLLFARCSNLRSLDLWRANHMTQNAYLSIIDHPHEMAEEEHRFSSLSADQQEELALVYSLVDMPINICSIGHITCLTEIDLGWTDPPPGFIQTFVQQAGRSLIKLFLTACRRISNADVMAVSEYCPKLRQFDLLGSNIIIEEPIEWMLKRCVHLEFIDLSFCSKISNATIEKWIGEYRSCFKRTYIPIASDDVYSEFP